MVHDIYLFIYFSIVVIREKYARNGIAVVEGEGGEGRGLVLNVSFDKTRTPLCDANGYFLPHLRDGSTGSPNGFI